MAATASDAVIQPISDALEKVLKDAKVISQLASMGAMPTYGSTSDFKAFLKRMQGAKMI